MYEDEFELTFQVPEEESAPEPLAVPAAKPAVPVVDEPTRIMTLEKPAAPVAEEPGAVLAKAESSLNLSNTLLCTRCTSFSYVLLRLNRRLQTESTAPEFKDRPPHYLSGGEKKRVSIADIIAMESEVIIFDEPTAALDPLNAAMLEEVLQKMGDEGRTMLISTHDVDFAYRWAERVIVFCHGKIIADDTPLAVFKQEDILKQANLKHPMMFDVYDILKEKGIVPDGDVYPKNIAEFQAMVKGL